MSARLEASGKDHFDLLPFIAILMCVLGCLLLVTMSIAALSIGPGLGEGWIPGAADRAATKVPVLIEWDGKTATVQRDGTRTELAWAPVERLHATIDGRDVELTTEHAPDPARAAFDTFVDELARQRDTHYALLAVRPSGFKNYGQFAFEFRRRRITLGSEPIDQQKSVRLLAGGRR